MLLGTLPQVFKVEPLYIIALIEISEVQVIIHHTHITSRVYIYIVYIYTAAYGWVATKYIFNCLSMDQMPTPLFSLFCPQTMDT